MLVHCRHGHWRYVSQAMQTSGGRVGGCPTIAPMHQCVFGVPSRRPPTIRRATRVCVELGIFPKATPLTRRPVCAPGPSTRLRQNAHAVISHAILSSDSPSSLHHSSVLDLSPTSPSPVSSFRSPDLASSRQGQQHAPPLFREEAPNPLGQGPLSTTSPTNMVSTGAAMGAPAAGTPQRQTLEKKPVKFSNLLRT